jgi:opacity protein-like surface antigen
MNMKLVVLAPLSLLAATSLAMAADLQVKAPPPPPTSNWTAIYVGGFAGGSWARGNFCGFAAGVGQTCDDFKVSGFVGGGWAGFDYELPNRVVIGARLAAPFGSLNQTNSTPVGFGPGGAAGTTITAKFNWAIFATGTVGYDLGQWMPYVGAGIVLASVDATINPPPAPTALTSSNSTQSQIGMNFLVGVKYALTRSWALGVQYNHVEFERTSYEFTGATTAAISGNIPVQLTQDSVVGTVDFRF